MPMLTHIDSYVSRLTDALERMPREPISELGDALLRAYRNDKQVFTLGNGGSASTASHMAADLAKNTIGPHMRRFRIASLNENAAIMTALANDIGYEHVFSEQLIEVIRARRRADRRCRRAVTRPTFWKPSALLVGRALKSSGCSGSKAARRRGWPMSRSSCRRTTTGSSRTSI